MASPDGERTRFGFLAPMKPELRPIVQMLGLQRDESVEGPPVYRRTFDGATVVATLTLIGTKAATTATERLLRDHDVDHVVVVGIAGGVPPAVRLGEVLVPEVVVDAATGAEYRPSPLGAVVPRGRVRTGDDLGVQAADMLAEGITACDMETASVAAVCTAQGVHGPRSVPSATSSEARSTTRCWRSRTRTARATSGPRRSISACIRGRFRGS